jgi:periplasmic mercuric ion binding protein
MCFCNGNKTQVTGINNFNMKKIILFLAVLFSSQLFAQRKAVGKATIKTPGMICDECKDRLEIYLGRADGVTYVLADVKKKIVKVQWLTERTNIEEIKTHIANAGFDADDVTANEPSYKRLPKCCKYDRPVPPPAAPVVAPPTPGTAATSDTSKPRGLKKDIFRRK